MGAAVAMRVDWFRVIADLRRCGFCAQAVADVAGVGKATVIGWKQGAEPSHATGERLISFWSNSTGYARELLPMTEIEMSAFRARA
ncbi:hypothetical protein PSm6_00140 [Pseudomonas solani]|uniref:Uncharacterized protein n=1 Tax=Pseudomonas solani TaxID=2731552 RepID=A0ABN6BH17_9PSED|nr:hypothetical protein PSm6_00140 [Pseudomonas solani]